MLKRKRSDKSIEVAEPPVGVSVYICGGQAAFRGGPVPVVLSRVCHENATPTGALGGRFLWKDDAELRFSRTAAGAALFEGSIYVVGGASKGGTALNRLASVEELRPSAGGTSKSGVNVAPALKTPRMSPGVAVVGGTLWAIGGW